MGYLSGVPEDELQRAEEACSFLISLWVNYRAMDQMTWSKFDTYRCDIHAEQEHRAHLRDATANGTEAGGSPPDDHAPEGMSG